MIGKIFKIFVNLILSLLVILGILVVFSFVPVPGNYKVFTVQSGSMEPAIGTGSLIFVKPEGSYEIGDIVTRRTDQPNITVTHRISDKREENGQLIFETKGDANNAPDGEQALESSIVGKTIFAVPYIGYPVGYAKTTPGLILLIIIPAVIIIYDEVNKIKKEVTKKMDAKKAAKIENEIKEETEELMDIPEKIERKKGKIV